MNRFLVLLGTVLFMGCVAVGQTGDLGAQIAAADAALGTTTGEIPVTASGTISEGQVALSVGHDLVCNDQVIISLNPGSYIYQNSHTRIKNCIISSSSTPITGEIQSVRYNVELDSVTFVGGGNLVYWEGVTDFSISDSKVLSTCFRPRNPHDDVRILSVELLARTSEQSQGQRFCIPCWGK